MSSTIGFDTSNYTTSTALYLKESNEIIQSKKLLPVKEGELGLRQSDALFHHTNQLPELFESLMENKSDIEAVGVSVRPRNVEGSYMPCFLAGRTAAHCVSASLGVPLFETSHQVGHILAALYSSGSMQLINERFIAFHVSGGTTDCLLCTPDSRQVIRCDEIGSSLDLKAGQAVDRVGLMLGLSFPCGIQLEQLALRSSRKYKLRPTIKGFDCCLSGIENQCGKMLQSGESKEDIALFCLMSIYENIAEMTRLSIKEFGSLPVLFAGGVMSNSIIRRMLENEFDARFAQPSFSSDNAAGVSIFAAIRKGLI